MACKSGGIMLYCIQKGSGYGMMKPLNFLIKNGLLKSEFAKPNANVESVGDDAHIVPTKHGTVVEKVH